MWIELTWSENPANAYARHTETLKNSFDLIRSHQQCIPWSPPLEIDQAIRDCNVNWWLSCRVDRSTNTYMHQLWANTGCSLQDMLRMMEDRDGCWERVWGFSLSLSLYIYIYIYMCVCIYINECVNVCVCEVFIKTLFNLYNPSCRNMCHLLHMPSQTEFWLCHFYISTAYKML